MNRVPVPTRTVGAALAAAALSLPMSPPALAIPPGFVDQVVIPGWDQAVGVCFDDDGRGFVWEKAGRVWIIEDGVKSDQPLIDISEEVGNWRDLGLLGFTLDPDFDDDGGHIYLLYAVDFHHLAHFGTPQYDPAADEYFRDTIGRLTRYTVHEAGGALVADPASRLVLVGESITTGFPITHESHSIGTVAFGEDGTLLVGNGDGSTYNGADDGGWRLGSSNTALIDGIITPEEDVGAFRAQMPDSLSGKILRIDPATGDGVPGNPLFDPADPRSARSRLWALGLRNPYRFTVRPGTGHTHGTGHPGTVYIGEVGWNSAEEIAISRAGGENFGWPLFEGLFVNQPYLDVSPANLHAPNPLHAPPACDLPFFRFHDLIIQATLAQPSWPNPCDPSQQVPPATPTFVHTRPVITWGHDHPVRLPAFDGQDASSVDLGDPDCPVQGEPFGGKSSGGGVWYTGSAFPEAYRNVYLQGDFVGGWIKAFVFDDADQLLEIRPLVEGVGAVVCMAVNPEDQALYYLTFSFTGQSTLRRIAGTDSAPPVARAASAPAYGTIPLTVGFSSAGSNDPDGGPLTFEWDFGDGSAPVHAQNPTHTYNGLVDLTPIGDIITRVTELDPPHPQGLGNWDPEVIRDRDYPPAGSADNSRQFDSFHWAAQGQDDYIGYTFDTPHVINRLVFQEGKHFVDGGWFDLLTVEYRDGGVWRPVQLLFSNPPYPGNNGVNYETFTFTFASVLADGIRVRGVPGGFNRFISVGELRVSGLPLGIGNAPRSYTARLTVRDEDGAAGAASVLVSAANSPPQVSITSPADGSFYRMTSSVNLPLRAVVSDAEHAPDDLQCRWQVSLHHNEHAHPEPPIQLCDPTVVLSPIGCDGETYYFEFALTVTDAHGLSTTRSSFMYPACCLPDWNLDGAVSSTDISAFLTDWLASLPSGSLIADVNGDGAISSTDISAFLSDWLAAVTGGGAC